MWRKIWSESNHVQFWTQIINISWNQMIELVINKKLWSATIQSDSFSILFWPRIKVHFKGCLVIRKVRKRLLGFPFGKSWNWLSLSLKSCIYFFMITASLKLISAFLDFVWNFSYLFIILWEICDLSNAFWLFEPRVRASNNH